MLEPDPPKPAIAPAAQVPPVRFLESAGFTEWLVSANLALAFTARRVGKVFLVGVNPQGGLSLFERTFEEAAGLAVSGDTLYLGTKAHIWRFENVAPTRDARFAYDRAYAPRSAHATGDVAVHEMAVGRDGRLAFVATRFSCLAALDETYSFRPFWRPPFITALASEDRCHLNGLGLDSDGQARFATAVAATDIPEGWREHRQDGGVVLDIKAGTVIARGLSMPHSPRLYEGRLWLLNSGTGELGYLDPAGGAFQPVAFCPGFLRGLALVNGHAVVSVSKPRSAAAFTGLPLEDCLKSRGLAPKCGILVVDLERGAVTHRLEIEGVIAEIQDVAILPGCRRPMLFGQRSPETARMYHLPEQV
jgi:uncharacterized protein (TIGR03032 family)